MAEAKKQVTHKQHWLPVSSHLSQFVDDKGVVQVYRYTGKGNDMLKTAKHFSVSPNAIGYENDLYERPDLPTNTVEDNLAKIEIAYGKVLENKIKQHKQLTEKEHHVVAQYIGLLQFRTPRHRAHLDEFFDRLGAMGTQMALAHDNPAAGDRFVQQVEETRKLMFTESMAIGQDVNLWQQLDFCFLEIDESYMRDEEFITSDHPVSVFDFGSANNPYGLHQWHKTAESIVPLTPKIALFGNRIGMTGYKLVDYNIMREINFRTVSASNQMTISHLPLKEYEKGATLVRFPQSLIVHYADFPDGRADKHLKKT